MISVGFKHFGTDEGGDIGDVVVIDHDLFDGDPLVVASTQSSSAGTQVTLIPVGRSVEAPSGFTSLGYMHRQEAEAVARDYGVELEDH